MKLDKFHSVIKNTPEHVREHVRMSMHILDRLNELLNKKYNGKQKLLADKLGKSEAEVSKWFNGVQNFTTKTLTKLSVAFGEPIIAVCTYSDDQNSTFTQTKHCYQSKQVTVIVDKNGNMEEVASKYENISKSTRNKNSKSDLLA